MKIILTGSLGHISRPVAEQLVAAGHDVTVISHNPQRAAEITTLGATPAIGSIADEVFLTQTFKGADAVYLMITAATDGANIFAAGRKQATIYANAVTAARVQHVVNLSSVGANLGPEVGSLHIYQIIEGVLTAALPNVNLSFIRPTGMYYNLYGALTSIKRDHAIYTNADLAKTQSWVAPADIVPVVLAALLTPQPGVTSQYVASDEQTYNQVAAILGAALTMPDLKAVHVDDTTLLANMTAAGLPVNFSQEYVKTGAYQRDHDFYADYRAHQPVLGPTKLTTFAQELAQAYQQV